MVFSLYQNMCVFLNLYTRKDVHARWQKIDQIGANPKQANLYTRKGVHASWQKMDQAGAIKTT